MPKGSNSVVANFEVRREIDIDHKTKKEGSMFSAILFQISLHSKFNDGYHRISQKLIFLFLFSP